MIEVEAKIKIPNPERYRQKIQSFAKYKGAEKKVDDYYTLQDNGKYPLKSIRIRKRKGFFEINFKHKINYKEGIWAKKETEFKVSDIEGFLRLVKDFGFKKWLTKEKYSEIYEIKNDFHVEINNVNGLGWFLEIECLTNEKGIAKAKKEILDILKKLEIRKQEIIKEGYTKLLWDKKK